MADLSQKDASSSVKIVGGAEDLNADVDAVDGSNAIHVINHDDGSGEGATFDPRPPFQVVHLDKNLLNGSSSSMAVNGSSTTVDFENGPPAGQIWFITHICIFITDAGTLDVGDFGGIAGSLTNGVQIIQEISSTEYELANMVNNHELSRSFSEHPFTPVATGGEGGEDGWFDTIKVFMGTKFLNPVVKLTGDNSDKIICRIRDNLTGLNEFTASFGGWRKI